MFDFFVRKVSLAFLKQSYLFFELISFNKQHQICHLFRCKCLPNVIKGIVEVLSFFLDIGSETSKVLSGLLEVTAKSSYLNSNRIKLLLYARTFNQ